VIALILYLALGAGLLVLLVAGLLRRRASAMGSSQALLDARQALSTLQGDLLPADVVQRVFAKRDLEYVLQATEQPIHQLFVDERRKVALIWVRQVRKGLVSLRTFHRRQARHYARLSFKTEVELAVGFAALLLACRALQVTLYFGGPYAAPRIVGGTVEVAARLCKVSEQSLAFLGVDLLGKSVQQGADQARI
jgi:hypothetical protein